MRGIFNDRIFRFSLSPFLFRSRGFHRDNQWTRRGHVLQFHEIIDCLDSWFLRLRGDPPISQILPSGTRCSLQEYTLPLAAALLYIGQG